MATDLGQGLIPEVDNIHTFDTTLEVQTFSGGAFTSTTDSFRTNYSLPQVLGYIGTDPIFGKTDAKIYFQVAPGTNAPFANAPDKLVLDSVVLVLNHIGTYGDTLIPQTIRVSEIDPNAEFTGDTTYLLSKTFSTIKTLGTSKSFTPASFKDSMQVVERTGINTFDTANNVINALRIKLDQSFGQRLLAYDSTGPNDGYSKDSIFRTKFKGFALESIAGGNAVMLFDNEKMDLKVYYRFENKTTAGDMDTAMATFSFYNVSRNGVANNITRDYNGTQVLTGAGDAIADQLLYIQNTPGTFANIKIPGLASLPGMVVHMAELDMESIYNPSDTVFMAPTNMFLDVYDSVNKKYTLVPNVFLPTSSANGGYDIGNLPGFYNSKSANQTFFYKKDQTGNLVKQWRFNLTGYVQHIVGSYENKLPVKDTAYLMRLYAPAGVFLPGGDAIMRSVGPYRFPQSTFGLTTLGRVRIGGGNHPTQKMKLRIVYSKPQ